MHDDARTTPGLHGWIGVALAAAMAMAPLSGDALAHAGGHGELSFHDSEDSPPQSSPSVAEAPVELTCRFWIEGSGMSHAAGTIEAAPSASPTERSTTVGTWEGQEDGNGTYSFEAGSFQLPETGIYSIWAQVEDDHRTVEHEVAYEACGDDGSGGEKIEPPIDID